MPAGPIGQQKDHGRKRMESDEIVVRVDTMAEVRALAPATEASLRSWVSATVGTSTWERTASLRVRLNGEITLTRYARADDGGYIIDLETGTALREEVVFQASAPFPVHLIGRIGT